MRAWRWLLLLLLAAIAALALTPAPAPELDLGWDKLNHLSAFAALGLCAMLGYRDARGRRLLVLAGLLAYGGLIEVLQLYVPNRSGEWGDLLADAIGIGIGALLALLWLRLRRR